VVQQAAHHRDGFVQLRRVDVRSPQTAMIRSAVDNCRFGVQEQPSQHSRAEATRYPADLLWGQERSLTLQVPRVKLPVV